MEDRIDWEQKEWGVQTVRRAESVHGYRFETNDDGSFTVLFGQTMEDLPTLMCRLRIRLEESRHSFQTEEINRICAAVESNLVLVGKHYARALKAIADPQAYRELHRYFFRGY